MDSLSYIHSLEAASELLRHQTNLLTWLIGILIIVFIAAAGISILFNRKLAKKYIDDEITTSIAQAEASMEQRLSESLAEGMKSSLKESEYEVYKNIFDLQGRVTMILAELQEKSNAYPISLMYWGIVLSTVIYLNEGSEIRRTIEHMIMNAEKMKGSDVDLVRDRIGDMLENVAKLPDTLTKERNKLQAILKGWREGS